MKSSILFLILSYLNFSTLTNAEVYTELAFKHLAEGENGIIHIKSTSGQIAGLEKRIQGNGFTMRYINKVAERRNTSIVYTYTFSIFPTRTGEFHTPEISIQVEGKDTEIPSSSFTVHKLSEFSQQTIEIGNRKHSYYTKLFINKDELYKNEVVTAELRYLLPNSLKLSQWAQVELDKNPSIISFEFQPPTSRNSLFQSTPQQSHSEIEGISYTGSALTTSLYSTETGVHNIGPIKATGLFMVNRSTGFSGFQRFENIRQKLSSPAINISIKDYPTTPPKEFTGNVGIFSLQTTLPEQKELSSDDSYRVSTTITGSGNFLSIDKPVLIDSDNWEILDTSISELVNPLSQLSNQIHFDFLLKPKKPVSTSPELSFTFFNPESETFEELKTTSTPLTFVKSSNAIQQTNSQSQIIPNTAINQLNILGLIPVNQTSFSRAKWIKYWHLIPLSLLTIILFCFALKIRRQKLASNPEKRIQLSELNQLKTIDNQSQFYKSVGRYINTWLEGSKEPKLIALKNESEQATYNPNSDKKDVLISSTKRSEIMKLLRSLCLIPLLFSISNEINANEQKAQQAYAEQDYLQAIEQYHLLGINAEAYYNIGVCHYKLDQPGEAALYFHKAKLIEKNHVEASQNIKFLAQQFSHTSASEVKGSDKWVSYLDRTTYTFLFQASCWLIFLTLLMLLCFKLCSGRRRTLVVIASTSSFITIASVVALQIYPKSIYFAPISELAVVTQQQQWLRTEPIIPPENSDTKNTITELPLASLCKPIAVRSQWTYIELPSQTRGWIKSDTIKAIQLDPQSTQSDKSAKADSLSKTTIGIEKEVVVE